MKPTRKLGWLSIAFAISACQSLPLPIPLPMATAIPTNTQGPPPTFTPLPSPTLPPTMEPVVRIDAADQALFFGDFDLAREQYRAAFNDSTDAAIKAAGLWGMGRTELADVRYQGAINALTNLINDYPDSTYAARAHFLMGLAYDGLGQYQQAADAYNSYAERVPGVLDGYVQDFRGDSLYEAGDYSGAQNAYNAALAEVCALYRQCRFDGGAAFNADFTKADVLHTDYFHPSISGQAKFAAGTWAVGYWAQ